MNWFLIIICYSEPPVLKPPMVLQKVVLIVGFLALLKVKKSQIWYARIKYSLLLDLTKMMVFILYEKFRIHWPWSVKRQFSNSNIVLKIYKLWHKRICTCLPAKNIMYMYDFKVLKLIIIHTNNWKSVS